MGISAPPTLIEMAMPQKALNTVARTTTNQAGTPGTKARTRDSSIRMLAIKEIVWWPRQITGRPLMTPANFAAAMKLPVKVKVPTQRARTAVASEKVLTEKNIVAPPTRADAAPPTPLSIPTI